MNFFFTSEKREKNTQINFLSQDFSVIFFMNKKLFTNPTKILEIRIV